MFLTWLIGNYKVVILGVLVAGIYGYIWFLRADVVRHQKETATLQADIAVLDANLKNAKKTIDNLNAGMDQYQVFVNQALDSLKSTQTTIQKQNKQLQKLLDNLAILAIAAKRIMDAPIIPFFTDNAVGGGAILISVDNGAYMYRMPPGPR
jgi:septal ring factor EnvC (AmiA/AmiB activator)